MKAILNPSTLNGTITAAASKSAMQRACAAALLRNGESILRNPGTSDDDKAARDIIEQLGALVSYKDDGLHIVSKGIDPINNELNCGESGLSVRMFTSIAALHHKEINITGKGSLLKRPLHFFDEVLPQLSVRTTTTGGHLPLNLQGPMQPADITIDGSLSSQYLTGLLFAYAASGQSGMTITVNNLASKPYIDLTLSVLGDFGLNVPVHKNYESFYFQNNWSNSQKNPLYYTVEGDWSGAAFLMVGGAIAGDVVVEGLDVFSTQADKAILQVLMQAEASLSVAEHKICIQKKDLKPFHFNATDCPDLFPPLVALAAYCNGTSVIEGVSRLEHKESNRGQTLKEEFGKLGLKIELQDDLMIIRGEGILNSAVVHSHHDHRIAMALAVAALPAMGTMEIMDAEAVNKSYPQFWEHLQTLGGDLSLIHND